jgi:hypothetical protein
MVEIFFMNLIKDALEVLSYGNTEKTESDLWHNTKSKEE